jgi:dipeptide transport system ATP-binding protein
VSVHYAGQKMEEQPVLDLFADPHHPYTSALLSALPERAEPGDLPSIPGVVPGLFDRPKACLFSPRCRYATDRCVTVKPAKASRAEGEALCHYPLVEGVPQGHPAFEAAL